KENIKMALRDYQTTLALATLYEVRAYGGSDQVAPNIWVKDGLVDVYVSNSGTQPPSAPTGMQIIENGEDLVGIASFGVLPRWLYVAQASSTITEIIVSGSQVTDVR